jgi:hypothetical protein
VEPDTACEADEKHTEAPRKTLKKISEPLCLGVVLGVLAAQKVLSPRAASGERTLFSPVFLGTAEGCGLTATRQPRGAARLATRSDSSRNISAFTASAYGRM